MQIADSQKSILHPSLHFVRHRQHLLVHALAFTALAVGIGALSFIDEKAASLSGMIKWVQLILFAAAGLLNTFFIRKHLFFFKKMTLQGFIFSLLLAAFICAALILLYAVFNEANLMMAIIGSSAFLLPFTLEQAWIFFKSISQEAAAFHPRVTEKEATVLPAQHLSIQLKIAKKNTSNEEALFSVTLSGETSLSKSFTHFLLNNNIKNGYGIELKDEHQQFYVWEFFLESHTSTVLRRLEPGLSLNDNGVKSPAVIIAKRVWKEEAVNEKFILYIANPSGSV